MGTLTDMGTFLMTALTAAALLLVDNVAAVDVPWSALGVTGPAALLTGLAIGYISGTRRKART